MPISNDPTSNILRMTVTVVETSTDSMVSFDVPTPIPTGMSITDSAIRVFYQKLINALESSTEFKGVQGRMVTELWATTTPD